MRECSPLGLHPRAMGLHDAYSDESGKRLGRVAVMAAVVIATVAIVIADDES